MHVVYDAAWPRWRVCVFSVAAGGSSSGSGAYCVCACARVRALRACGVRVCVCARTLVTKWPTRRVIAMSVAVPQSMMHHQ